jgi:subtilase family serine protease
MLQAEAIPEELVGPGEQSVPLSTGGRSGADLIIDYIYNSWTTSEAGETESVNVRLENQGTDSTGSFYWGIYLSTDTTITTNDIELDSYYKSSMSAGSTTSTFYKTVTIPTTITGGRYYVGALADINTQVSESNENNNDDYYRRVTIDEQPDLTGRTCSAPNTGVVGDYIDSSISISIENDPGGSYIASSGSFDWAMYLSTDSTITTSDTQVGYDQSKSSISGGSYSSDSLSTSNRIPSSLNPGTYYWGYIVDVDDDVDEQDENNNDYTCSQVTIEDDLPDIVADDVGTSSSSAVMGDTISVTYRIDNDGHDYTGSFYWELYLSTDRTITTSDIFVDEFSRSSISPGYYYSGTQYSVQIPSGINPGYYYLGMIADSRTSVSELDETNNVVADSGRINIEEQADLVPGTVSGPNSAYTGDQVSLSWRINNDGDDDSGWFYWKAYLSTDRTITSSDTQVGSTQQASSIYGGSYRSGSLSVTIPSSLSTRTYYWGIIADTTDRVDEGDESNNADDGNSISITVGEPDLRADYISVNSATRTICEQGTVTVDLDVSNQGNVNANAHYYDVLFSTSGGFGTWISIGQGTGPGGVSSYTHQPSGTIPASMTPGTYYVRLSVDYGDYISESDEFNNDVMSSTAQLTVQQCDPDLVPTVISGPSAGARGGTVQVSVSVANQGVVTANDVPVDIFLSADQTITNQDVYVGSKTIASLSAGSTWSDTLALTVPSNLGSGCWYWGVLVDINNAIPELDETNNALANSQQFCVQQPNLRVVSVSAPASATSGQSVDVVVSIQNSGGSAAPTFECRLLLSSDSSPSSDDVLLDTFSVQGLAAGSSTSQTLPVQFASDQVGTYHFVVEVDTGQSVAEEDETDNSGASVQIHISAPTLDLLAEHIESANSAEPGQTLEISWGVENLGQDALGFQVDIWLSADRSLDEGDTLLTTTSISSLAGGAQTDQTSMVHLTDNMTGSWWLLLHVDSAGQHAEDDEVNNLLAASRSLRIDTEAPEPEGNGLPGCDNPNSDGESGSDAAGTRSSATNLGLDPVALTIDGCLLGSDADDWYSFVLSVNNQTTIALTAEGAEFSIVLHNGTAMLEHTSTDIMTPVVTVSVLNQDADNSSLLFHIHVSRASSDAGGAYRLRLATVNGSEDTDLLPPPAPELTPLEDWTSADELPLEWPQVVDEGSSGLSHYEVRWAGGLWSQVSNNSTSLNISVLADGRHSLEVRAVDNAGNVGPASAIWVRIDRSPPTVIVSQLDAQYAGPPVLHVGVVVDDGEGSGIGSIQWSFDNHTWIDFPPSGAIIWSDWDDLDLYVRVTDGTGSNTTAHLDIVPPSPPQIDDGPSDSSPDESVSGTSVGEVTMWVLFVLLLAGVAAAGIFLAFRGRGYEEDDDEHDEGEAPEPPPAVAVEPTVVHAAQLQHVADHTWLPSGGAYDQSTGTTVYVAPDGGRWWQQPDGSFLLEVSEAEP